MITATSDERVGELVGDLEIEQWVHERYGFAPHPFWISHCKEIFLHGIQLSPEARPRWHECPPDKRLVIKEAFVHFGILADPT